MECWNFMKCNPSDHGGCPAYPDKGNECWKVTGTKCNGGKMEMASRREKIQFCSQCGFYQEFAIKF